MDAAKTKNPLASPGDDVEDELSREWRLAEHDRSLIRWMLSLTPLERLRHAEGFAQSAAILRDARRA